MGKLSSLLVISIKGLYLLVTLRFSLHWCFFRRVEYKEVVIFVSVRCWY
jgi:hypothetical protein